MTLLVFQFRRREPDLAKLRDDLQGPIQEASQAFARLGASAEDATRATERLRAAMDDPEFLAWVQGEVDARWARRFLAWYSLGFLAVVLALALPWLLS